MNTAMSVGEAVKNILRSGVTGGESPEDILRHLDSCGIEWHVTEEGTLMIRCWQIGAEGFVSPEQVGTIASGHPVLTDGPALQWVSRNLEGLRQRYGGEWIAVAGSQVVAHAQNLSDLLVLIPPAAERPFVTQIPAAPIVWHTTYAG